jgi:hypothetical protein
MRSAYCFDGQGLHLNVNFGDGDFLGSSVSQILFYWKNIWNLKQANEYTHILKNHIIFHKMLYSQNCLFRRNTKNIVSLLFLELSRKCVSTDVLYFQLIFDCFVVYKLDILVFLVSKY